jgi:uncharacterized protein (DUF1697 family)
LAPQAGGAGMTTHVALLYSVVIDKSRRVAMADLRQIAERLGYRNVRTLVSTGNMLFDVEPQEIPGIETALECAFADFHGKHIDFIVRTADRWRQLVAANPFAAESAAKPDRVVVRVMRTPADETVAALFAPYQTAGEKVAIVDGDVWIAFPGQPSQSRLLRLITPKRMGGIGTMRNWNTVRRLGEILGG